MKEYWKAFMKKILNNQLNIINTIINKDKNEKEYQYKNLKNSNNIYFSTQSCFDKVFFINNMSLMAIFLRIFPLSSDN